MRAANAHFRCQSEGSLRPHAAAFHPAANRQGAARVISFAGQAAGERTDGLRRAAQSAECPFEHGCRSLWRAGGKTVGWAHGNYRHAELKSAAIFEILLVQD